MEKLVSIIVPVYNVENYLETCVNSLLKQTYNNIEIILVDDGSTDHSGEICDKYADQHSVIRVIHQENQGLSGARNHGIAEAKGEYISLVDSDDFVSKDFIQALYAPMISMDCDMVCMETHPYLDGDEKSVYEYWRSFHAEEIKAAIYERDEIYDLALYQIVKVTGAQQKLYKKTLFDTVRFPEGKYYEDLGSLPDVLYQIHKFALLDHSLYAYRIRQNSIMNENFNQHKMDCIWVSDHVVDFTRQNMPEERHINAAFCAAFRVNRVTYAQIPKKYEREKNKVWEQICRYRNCVMHDSRAPKYDRVLSAVSYLGQGAFDISLNLFSKLKAKRR